MIGTLRPIYSEYKKHMLPPELKQKKVEYDHVYKLITKFEDNYKRISKNDELTIEDKTVDANGLQTIKIHPDFKIILTINARN